MSKRITEDGEIVDIVSDDSSTTIYIPGPNWKTPNNHDTQNEALASATACKDPSRTQQQFAKDADINAILAKFLQTGELNVTGTPTYQVFEKDFDLQDEMVTAYQVNEAWLALPAAARNILKDPKVFADYVDHCVKCGDLGPLEELGLGKAKPPQPPTTGGGAPPLPGGDKAPDGA